MTTGNPDDALARATRELREAPQPGWTQIRDSVIGAVRATSRRTQPVRATIDVSTEDAERGRDTLHITDQVLRTYLNRALTEASMSAPVDVAFDLDENSDCHGADIDLVGAYGTDLQQLGEHTRRVAATVLSDLLGRPLPVVEPADVHVTVSDIIQGDPRTT